jgi:hypothetical protein
VHGARAVQEAIIDGYPDADISVSIVWINMLPLDNRAMAHVRAQTMQDPRARHFSDPRKRVGRAIAQSLGGRNKVAWDIYLFYAPGAEWDGGPPPPAWWAHQLTGSSWADAAHYHRGDELVEQLRRAMADLLKG